MLGTIAYNTLYTCVKRFHIGIKFHLLGFNAMSLLPLINYCFDQGPYLQLGRKLNIWYGNLT